MQPAPSKDLSSHGVAYYHSLLQYLAYCSYTVALQQASKTLISYTSAVSGSAPPFDTETKFQLDGIATRIFPESRASGTSSTSSSEATSVSTGGAAPRPPALTTSITRVISEEGGNKGGKQKCCS